MVLERFSPATRDWFEGAFAEPTPAQLGAWDAVASGQHALVVAPTGSGKTLAAFLWSIDRLISDPEVSRGTRVLYVSPLKALGVDVERNLRSPIVGVTRSAARLGLDVVAPTVGVRSGDTTSQERRALARTPPDILITTPESLYLMLTSQARETLRGVETVILDEVHAVASTKRGAHLALSLERLDALLPTRAQRIGLSATVRPLEEVARFLGGSASVTIVQPPAAKTFDLTVAVPVDDMAQPGMVTFKEGSSSGAITGGDGGASAEATGSIWPHVEEAIVDRVLEHRSTIVFVNARRQAERLTARLNEIYEERFPDAEDVLLARAHHGSVSKDQRAEIEDELKSGRLRCVVATSSLELGIDMGAVDLVVQVESPPSVASGLQRIGRAGHQVGEISRGVLFPKHRTDLIHTSVVVDRMRKGLIEAIAVPQNPLDVLAQQTVAAASIEQLDVEEWFDTVRRSAPFATLPRSAFDATLDLVSGLYPSDEFAELRPRVTWDRVAGTLVGRPGAQRLAVTSGGTIPDRGLFGVFMVGSDSGRRVGELDEEMVYESRVGDVFALGTTSWRIEQITHDQVLVSPAFGQPGRVPFWKGDGLGRPAELGEAIGAFVREVAAGNRADLAEIGLDERARTNLVSLIAEQKAATGHVPNDTTLLVERFRDELGDWRVVLHSPYGMPVHAPWALAVGARVRDRLGVDGAAMAGDDGIVVRVPDTDADPPGAELFLFELDELDHIVTDEVGGSALFAARFRESAARALLLPRRDPGKRSPLWQQRQRASQLLDVARKYPTFPIVLETVREVLQDVYDVPTLRAITTKIGQRAIRVAEVETPMPSPFARSLLFGYTAAFLYEGDAPLAERRAAALSLDPALLAELLGRAELRELLDPVEIERTERELQRLAPERHARDLEGIVDVLRMLGPLSRDEIRDRASGVDVDATVDALLAATRALVATVGGVERVAAVEDAGRLRDALGVPLPLGIPAAFTEEMSDPVGELVSRFARTHAPFTVDDVASRFGLGPAVVLHALRRLESDRRVVEGEFRPGATGTEWCSIEVLRRLRARSLAALRDDVEPVSEDTLGRFLPSWQHVGGGLRGVDGVLQVIEQLGGVAIPASALETLVLPARVADYSPALLDELTVSGEVQWSGAGSLPGSDGWVRLQVADSVGLLLYERHAAEVSPLGTTVLESLQGGGAYFFRQLANAVGVALLERGEEPVTDSMLLSALWELVWDGLVTNDSLAPLRAHLGRRAVAARPRRSRGRSLRVTQSGPAAGAGRWSLVFVDDADDTTRAKATAEALLERHGVVTRGSVVGEGIPGGFALTYRVLSGFEEQGRVRRGYFVDGLGAAQFAAGATVDRLRTFAVEPDTAPELKALTLAATDPANPYGAALAWPPREGHRPGRKAGALVTLVDGRLAVFVEKGGKSIVTFADDDDILAAAARSLLETARSSSQGLKIERIDGDPAQGTPFGAALLEAGIGSTPAGLRLRV
ncbi:ATP-dependent Lhr-like helicase [Microbacteriaceae bacterium SG_E_30_P1]|uniref:ATP-dependent Lhr-like helicase n=1 Tax=Antiquaquibacter oligotrophicus TaxID=2880260 RepID=A0ABT6KP71_9MICO|nr:ATP-dependent helicase [Antiquaquibacter oligotrophicus]MDH6180947.1 ATP-dependent Lhr-like helicase [Antiquaquibacter oligotrophicus]UDF13351.1 ATP-dependent helicase [Antiquaquibacter oligotrophicus]